MWGLRSGFIKIGVALGILVFSMAIAGSAAFAIGPSLSWIGDGERGGTAVAFLVVFTFLMVAGALVNLLLKIPLTIASSMVSTIPVVSLLNRAGGLISGVLFGWILISVTLIGLQQLPVGTVGKSIDAASFASGPISWADRYVTSIEIVSDREGHD